MVHALIVLQEMKTQRFAILIVSTVLTSCVTTPNSKIPKQTTSIHRQISTPSGDWGGSIGYIYNEDGELQHISYDFITFTGYDSVTEEFKATRCMREYDVTKKGELVQRSKVTTDLTTKATVERQFYEPEIAHWMTLSEANQESKKQNKTVVATAGKVPRSLRSGHPFSAVPHL